MVSKKHFPYYVFILPIFPTLALLATNISQVNLIVVVRPLAVSLIASIILFLLAEVMIRDWYKAALVVFVLLLLFFSYGQVYHLLRQYFFSLARHRYLGPVYGFLFLFALWLIVRKLQNINAITLALNVVSVIVLVFPSYQVIAFSIIHSQQNRVNISQGNNVSLTKPASLPDVYYIVLDTHMRSDALLRDMNYDNSDFVNQLEAMGFYVAGCSRSNYSFTQASLISALDMNYLPQLQASGGDQSWDTLIKQSQTRRLLQSIGYKTVAFETSYEWSQLDDADIMLGIGKDPMALQSLYPFEVMLIKSTAILIPLDLNQMWLATRTSDFIFQYKYHVDLENFIMDQLPEVPAISGPKFVFVHILIPHLPYVFGPHGEVLTDPGFYTGKDGGAVDEAHFLQGYDGEVQYVDSRMLAILKKIITNSKIPPIIVMHGDTGVFGDNRWQILNAYYLPGGGNVHLYPDISPVNSFRVVFDTYFGTNFALLPDQSFEDDLITLAPPDNAPQCQK